jgi:aquaporin TIP
MASGDNNNDGGFREAVLGREGGKRQRFFRKAREQVEHVAFRLTPSNFDDAFKRGLAVAAVAELLGTLWFVFIGAGAACSLAIVNRHAADASYVVGVALAHGIALALAIAITVKISGGHINPAVTLAVILTGRLDVLSGVVYWIAQFIGAALGALIVLYAFGSESELGVQTLHSGVSSFKGFVIEAIITFNLVVTIWGVAIYPRGKTGHLAPLLIGLSLFIGILFGAPLTGASMNPARTFGPALVSWRWDNFWVYLLGPFVGAIVAGLLYEFAFVRTDKAVDDEIFEEITDNNAPPAV